MKKLKTKQATSSHLPAGFTLVELMIVLAILGIVVVGVMGVIISQNKKYYSEESLIDMQLNANVAIDRLTRQVRMAGFGCKDGIKANGLTINGTTYNAAIIDTNSTTGPDQLTVICGLEEVSDVDKNGSGDTTYNSSTIILKTFTDTSGVAFFDSSSDDKKFCYISNSATQKALSITGVDSTASSINLGSVITVSEFDKVFRVRAYTYSVKPGSSYSPQKPFDNLVQEIEGSGSGRIEIAEGIEDLQFQFGWDIDGGGFDPSNSGDWAETLSTGDADKVIAVKIILLAITLYPEQDEEFTDLYDDQPSTAGRQYTQADHIITYTASGYQYGEHYHRLRLESIVFIRNLNL